MKLVSTQWSSLEGNTKKQRSREKEKATMTTSLNAANLSAEARSHILLAYDQIFAVWIVEPINCVSFFLNLQSSVGILSHRKEKSGSYHVTSSKRHDNMTRQHPFCFVLPTSLFFVISKIGHAVFVLAPSRSAFWHQPCCGVKIAIRHLHHVVGRAQAGG